jgi:hypothetical protein
MSGKTLMARKIYCAVDEWQYVTPEQPMRALQELSATPVQIRVTKMAPRQIRGLFFLNFQ